MFFFNNVATVPQIEALGGGGAGQRNKVREVEQHVQRNTVSSSGARTFVFTFVY